MTIVYLKLKYCGYAYRLFEGILKDKQYSGNISDPVARLFAQFHGPQTKRMKKDIIHEIGKENSRIRVIFATSALGRAFFNYITGGAKAPPGPMVAPPLNHFGPPSQSPFSLKYKQNMEFRREV